MRPRGQAGSSLPYAKNEEGGWAEPGARSCDPASGGAVRRMLPEAVMQIYAL